MQTRLLSTIVLKIQNGYVLSYSIYFFSRYKFLEENYSFFQKQHGTLVFSRSTTPPHTTTPAVNTVAGISSVTPASAPVSFAAIAAAGTNKAKENAMQSSLNRSGTGAPPALGQSQLGNVNSLYQKYVLLSFDFTAI